MASDAMLLDARMPFDDAPTSPAPEVEGFVRLGCDIWIFGYGSLMWNPGFRHCAAEAGLLRGWHRSFCVYSHRYRGTPERPGLVLGLDRGGSCRGMVFRVSAENVTAAMNYLWEREMTGGVYEMREVAVATAAGTVTARAFVVRR